MLMRRELLPESSHLQSSGTHTGTALAEEGRRPAVSHWNTVTADPGDCLLKVEGLRVSFRTAAREVDIIDGLDFELRRGEVVAVVGESGSGKSVSALAIMGLLPPFARVSAGRVLFQGRNLLELDAEGMRRLRGKDIGMVFQDPMSALNPVLTIGEQIAEPLRLHLGMSHQQARARVLELLNMVGIADAESRIDLYPHEFSGGMRQRVMIAIALACQPSLLIADEPTTALDVTIQAQILELLKNLADRLGIALMLITHNLGVVARYADRVLVMYGGQLVEQGLADTLFHHPRHMYTLGLLRCVPRLEGDIRGKLAEIPGLPPDPREMPPGCRFAPRCPQRIDVCRNEARLVATDVGSASRCHRVTDLAAGSIGWPEPAPGASLIENVPASTHGPAAVGSPAAMPLLEARDLTRVFNVKQGMWGKRRQVTAVRQVNFSLDRGETLGVVGESGCGKSTLARMVLRLDRPSAGQILFGGHDITNLGHRLLRPVRRRMQVVFQDPAASLNPRMTIGQIIGEPMRVHGLVRGDAEEQERVIDLLRQVGLRAELYGRYSHQISGGQRQRVGIARALALDPSLIVCDEAVSALDVSVQAQVVNLLADLQQQRGLAYLFIAHDLALVRRISNRVMVMYLGRVVEYGSREHIYAQPTHPYTRLLLEAVPGTDPREERKRAPILIQGDLPSPFAPPDGCAFRTRCPRATADCARAVPQLREVTSGHYVACDRV